VSPLHFQKALAELRLTLAAGALRARASADPGTVGRELARQVDQAVRRENLGYYPALGYFEVQGGVERELLDTARDLAGLATELVREDAAQHLRQAFAQVEVERLQALALTLPSARPGQSEALSLLARHYTPDTVRVAMVLTSIQRRPAREGMDLFVRRTLFRWLRDRYAEVRVASVCLLP
jgi:hypothetical protein